MTRDLERERDEMIRLLEVFLPKNIRDLLAQSRLTEQPLAVNVTTNEQGTCNADTR
jgi:hypothetical protein